MQDIDFKNAVKTSIVEFHARGIPPIVERTISIPEFKSVNKVIVIIGPRRTGKTFLLYQIMKKMIEKGKTIQDFLYLNFENERVSGAQSGQLQGILDAYAELYPERTPIIFFDEIQNITGWDTFIRRLNDENHSIYITGSNSRLLSKEIATALRGRDFPIQLLPFSFEEFLRVRKIERTKNWEYGKTKLPIKKAFEEYEGLSGYPEIVLENKLEFIDDYFKTVLFRDAVERNKIKNSELLRLLMKYITRQYAQEYTINKFNHFAQSNAYKSSTSVIQRYSKILEDIYFCFFLNAKQKSFKK